MTLALLFILAGLLALVVSGFLIHPIVGCVVLGIVALFAGSVIFQAVT